jgi:hypothetical protein
MTKVKIKKKRVTTTELRRKVPADERPFLPAYVDVPEQPIYGPEGDEKAEHEEQQVARVELMMLKGIRQKRTLMTLLEIPDHRKMDRFIRRVYARWEMTGATQEHMRHRGEALNRLDLIESETWSRLSNLDPKAAPQVSLNYLAVLLKIQEQRSQMLGLTPKVIAHIGVGDDANGDFARRVARQEFLAKFAARMNELIQERTRFIEHESSPE